ncbi:YafY family protein [Saccharibacillus sacchari]|uniref:YafY family protein n=1 Tax=Saccharibacillus sacchari TaxID=456493 RepID=A0ACC6PFL3_9BACL
MNKTDRMLAILLRLQRERTVRAEDLAETFETSVRTIYRDMQALSEAGVPLLGTPGAGYSLIEGYFLPPVMLTEAEALAALIGADLTHQTFGGSVRAGASTFREKLEHILPPNLREEVANLRETARLAPDGAAEQGEAELERVELLREAVLRKRKVEFTYTKAGEESRISAADPSRAVAPYGLVLVRGVWMLIAHCDRHREIRHFRVSRIGDLRLMPERFELPGDFRLSDYRAKDDRTLRAVVRADRSAVERVKELRPFYLENIEDSDGEYRLHFRMRHEKDLLPLLLGLGASAEVLEPESLRALMRNELQHMRNRY